MLIDIVTITKDDFTGLKSTIKSTTSLRATDMVKQIVIDSSSKKTSDEVKSFLAKQKNIEFYYQFPKGISSAFNYGLSKASAEWIWFLNGGDKFNSTNIDLFVNILRSTVAQVVIFDISLNGSQIIHPPIFALWPPIRNWIPHPSTIVKRQLLKKVGGFDERFKIAMDGDLWFRLMSQDVCVDLISLPVVEFSPRGLSKKTKERSLEELKVVWKNRGVITRRNINSLYLQVRGVVSFVNKLIRK